MNCPIERAARRRLPRATAARTRLAFAALLLVFAIAPANAGAILGAAYDASRDELIVDIAYRGTTPGHAFVLHFGACRSVDAQTYAANARLVDAQGDEIAIEDFMVRQRYALGGFDCRPGNLTLRLGPISHVTLNVPAPPAKP